MPKRIVIYAKPADPDAFLKKYETHMGLAAKVPGVRSAKAGLVANSNGVEPTPYLAAVLDWTSDEAMKAGMTTAEWKDLVTDASTLGERPSGMMLINDPAK